MEEHKAFNMSNESGDQNSLYINCKMKSGQLISDLDKKFLEGNHQSGENCPKSQESTESFPVIPILQRFVQMATEDFSSASFDIRRLVLKNIPLDSRKFSEEFSNQLELLPQQTISNTLHIEKMLTKFAVDQGLFDSSRNRQDTSRQGSPRLSCQHQSPSLPDDMSNNISAKQNSSEDYCNIENKDTPSCSENSVTEDVSNEFITVDHSHPTSYSAPACFCSVTPKYVHVQQDEYFSTPIYENTFVSTMSTFSKFRTPVNIPDSHRYDPVTSLIEIEVGTLEGESITFIQNQNGGYYLVGEGTYGSVFLAQLLDVPHLVCVKEFSELTPNTIIVHEAKILTYLQDTGLVPEFHGISRSERYPDELSLVQEFCANGITFRDLLKGPESECSVRDRIRILYNLSNGLKVLHQKDVLWNDIKANNILVDIENRHQVTFIDFGVASYKSGRHFCISGKNEPFYYLAPEVRDGYATSQASDIYSLGYLMLYSLMNQPISQNLVKLCSLCVEDNPRDRPSIMKIIKILELFL